jgi:ketosteroid isomerase-like protein
MSTEANREAIRRDGVANDGIAYDNSYAWFVTLRDGLVVDGTAYFDSIAFDDFWRRCDVVAT